MSYSASLSRALRAIAPRFREPNEAKAEERNWSNTRLSAIENEAMMPSVERFSGIKPTPASRD